MRIISTFFIASLLGCSQSSENKPLTTDSLISLKVYDYMVENLKDPASYQSIHVWKHPRYLGDTYLDSSHYYSDVGNLKKANKMLEKYHEEMEKGPFVGWTVHAKYRAKNGYGALDIHEKTFYMDSTLYILKAVD